MSADTSSTVRIAVIYPEALGTYGDVGNALVLAKRLSWRGLPVELVRVSLGAPVPERCDIYVLGGGEDVAQAAAAVTLARAKTFRRAVEGGAAVLAVCAGFQILGVRYPGPGGRSAPGVGLLDVTAVELPVRAVGDAVVDATPHVEPVLTGFENHRNGTVLGEGVQPLGRMVAGLGNGDGFDGAVSGAVIATYLHGPVLAGNPALADRVLSSVLGVLPPLEVPEVDALRRYRLNGHLRDTRVTRVGPSPSPSPGRTGRRSWPGRRWR